MGLFLHFPEGVETSPFERAVIPGAFRSVPVSLDADAPSHKFPSVKGEQHGPAAGMLHLETGYSAETAVYPQINRFSSAEV
jgi:hypothetical protein